MTKEAMRIAIATACFPQFPIIMDGVTPRHTYPEYADGRIEVFWVIGNRPRSLC